jgi:hypothetical protein
MLIWLGKQYLGQTDNPISQTERPDEQQRQSIVIGGREIFF